VSRRHPQQDGLAQAYDAYFASRLYEQRYPAPNPSTLAFLSHWIGPDAPAVPRQVLDVGCGNGRYGIPLLASGDFGLVGCDISATALQTFEQRLQGHPARDRVQLFLGEVGGLPDTSRFDVILMMFGVLAHIETRAARLATLRALHRRASPGALLLLSVPNALRRMPLALGRAVLGSAWSSDTAGHWADIRYQRVLDGRPTTFNYHLYLPSTLARDLAEGGWRLQRLEAESAMPESWVCRRPALARLDEALRARLPAVLGYGLRAVAVAA
jgi:tRNA (uracil-5-)-methyltransferase TRM9